jgi:hypothetical protein
LLKVASEYVGCFGARGVRAGDVDRDDERHDIGQHLPLTLHCARPEDDEDEGDDDGEDDEERIGLELAVRCLAEIRRRPGDPGWEDNVDYALPQRL